VYALDAGQLWDQCDFWDGVCNIDHEEAALTAHKAVATVRFSTSTTPLNGRVFLAKITKVSLCFTAITTFTSVRERGE
jgi:hypothetical protein